jgi:hypothetical protein
MTHAVSALTTAATPAETHRTSAPRAASTSFAQVQAAAVKSTEDKDTTTSSAKTTEAKGKTTADAPKGERTQAVEGHSYKEIVAGPRNGMFINNTGNGRDGRAFLIVKREGREFHVYGTGEDRKVYEVGRKREATADNGAKGDASKPTTTSDSSGTAATGTTSGTATA